MQHKNLVAGRWGELSFAEQMGNVGSEVGRAITRLTQGETVGKEKALERAFELMDLTIGDGRWALRAGRLKELARVRESLADFFYGSNEYATSSEDVNTYFYHFAYAARKSR